MRGVVATGGGAEDGQCHGGMPGPITIPQLRDDAPRTVP
jgi:hypothetical protein